MSENKASKTNQFTDDASMQYPPTNWALAAKQGFIASMILFVGYWLYTSWAEVYEPTSGQSAASGQSAVSTPIESPAQRDERLIEISQNAVRQRLKDGDSAKFRNVSLNHPKSGTPAFVVCGEVNSKNSFGGYGGYQMFIAAGSNPKLVFLREQVSDFLVAWKDLCV